MEHIVRSLCGKGAGFVIALSILYFLPATESRATHLRAGEITLERISCSSREFLITVTVYTNTLSTVRFGGDGEYIDFGDGTVYFVEHIQNTPRPDLGPNIGTASISVPHRFPAPGTYTISWREPNRNEGVLNMFNSVGTTFYIETQLIIDGFLGCNDTPELLIAPIDRSCVGVTFFHNPGAFDPDGDSLSYELVVPYRDRNQTVIDYKSPIDASFYAGLDYATANEERSGPPEFTIDPVTGTLKWDAPGMQGEYNIAFIIKEWRKKNGIWYPMGFVRRDMQILVEDCENERPKLIVPNDTCVVAGTTLDATIFGIDPENHNVKIEAFSEIFQFPPSQSPATYSPVPGTNDFQPSSPPAELHFQWNVECGHVKNQPYQVVFKITDNPPKGPRLVSFETWQIRVVGPSPEWESVEPDLANRYANLEWEPYFCSNASVIQVWRKVDGFDFTPDNCQTGMPEYLGYTLIASLPASENGTPTTTYTDTNGGKGLDVGASYCYRLVALFPAPRGGESYVSLDACLEPFLSDAPVITHVTVDRTSLTDGQITVSWRKPFDIDPAQYPGPYRYELWRALGFSGNAGLVKVHAGTLPPDPMGSDTTFTDNDPDLNTLEQVYNYRVVLYSNTIDDLDTYSPIDTSAVASTVRLDLQSLTQEIDLSWSAVVPWSNQAQDSPYHLIYRGSAGATVTGDLILIDSVNVTLNPFAYADRGQFNDTPLSNDEEYCYQVVTYGTYGNPDIEEPLINFSQIACAVPDDNSPPCKPELQVQLIDCDEFLKNEVCNFNTFSNTIFWNRPEDPDCRADVRSYNIYVANSPNASEFVLIAENVRDTFFVDKNLPSFARCYKISAVDRSGNESELSDPVCAENCPNYELPNIFSPGQDAYNPYFSAYGTPWSLPENPGEEEVIANEDRRCARFVQRVRFKVYNRWGKELYTYTSGGERTIYIDWDGRDSNGRELAAGIYYYQADVTFDMADPAKRNRTYKGWIHLVR